MLKFKRGLLFAAFSAAFYSVKNLCMEVVITNDVDPFQMLVMVMPLSTVGSLIWLLSKKIEPPQELTHYLWLLFSGFLFTSFAIFFAFSVQNLDVGDAITVSFTSLIQVGVWSWIVLREPLRLLDLGFAVLAFIGVTFVARPSFIFGTNSRNNTTLLGVCFALVSSVSIALLIVVLRKHQQLGINTFVSIFANSVVTIITSAICCTALQSWIFPAPQEWIFLELAGIAYFIAQSLACCALHYESATVVVITTTLEIVLTFLLQFAFLNVVPEWMSYIGALLIIASCVGMALSPHMCQKREREN
ncbi:Solute carrier family 35 member G1 [Holothuria leucospilota]|uniref:Solute carrier family 35 member G1 n=1 Tax=Holothuria leucospilota TaxID=206669 RepID=A0A9Q1BYH1_HOLLE|nr:Solute carrier family 35 member G1 [Holothuria leucospilota]